MRTFRSDTDSELKILLILILTSVALAFPSGQAEQRPSETDRRHLVDVDPATVESPSTVTSEPVVDAAVVDESILDEVTFDEATVEEAAVDKVSVDEETKQLVEKESSEAAEVQAQNVVEPTAVEIEPDAEPPVVAVTESATDSDEALDFDTTTEADEALDFDTTTEADETLASDTATVPDESPALDTTPDADEPLASDTTTDADESPVADTTPDVKGSLASDTTRDADEPLPSDTTPVAEGDESQNTDATPEDGEEQPPVAENVDLSEPFELPQHSASDATASDSESGTEPVAAQPKPEKPEVPLRNEPIVVLGTTVPVGTSARLSWSPDQSFEGIAAPTPVLVVNGTKPGPTVCLTAAVHGDELNGIEIVRSVLYDLSPGKLAGTVIGVPIVNLQGFRRSSRYLPDRRDLNRYFPGNSTGSSASRIAHSFFREVISHCDALVDLHTGSFHRTNLPQLRADLSNPQVARLTEKFGATVVLHSSGARGTLRRAATDAGIPAVTLEAGEPTRVQNDAVSHGTRGIMTLLNELKMVRRVTFWGSREPVYYRSTWIRADQGGVLISKVDLGERVKRGDVLGTVTDPITNVQSSLVARASGRVLGMALNQFVMPGFAAYRLGIDESDHPIVITPLDGLDGEPDELAEEEEVSALNEDEQPKSIDARDYLEDSE